MNEYPYTDLTGDISALPVQPDQEVLPGQLHRRQPDQQLGAGEPTIAGLDRPDRRIQQLDHAQAVNQLGHRGHPRHRGQRRVRRADLHPPPRPGDLAYSAHLIGVLPTLMTVSSQTPSSQVRRAPITICGPCRPATRGFGSEGKQYSFADEIADPIAQCWLKPLDIKTISVAECGW